MLISANEQEIWVNKKRFKFAIYKSLSTFVEDYSAHVKLSKDQLKEPFLNRYLFRKLSS